MSTPVQPPSSTALNQARATSPWVQRLVWLLFAAAALYGILEAVSLAWVCDDAFISFRCAGNLVDGHGLVFNTGERVEAYTNFLWTVIMAAGLLLNADVVYLSQILGIASYLFTVVILLYLSIRLTRSCDGKRTLVLPVAAAALLVHHDCQVWATSGLETAWTTALIVLGFAILVRAQTARSIFAGGTALILAALSRPDAMILYLAAFPYIVLMSKTQRRQIIFYLVPLLAVYLPYWIIRYAYYGYPFPNAYYAKSASLSYYSQGILYLWLYVKTYYIFLLVPVVSMAALPRLLKEFISRRAVAHPVDRVFLLGGLFVVAHVLYVVRVGGDFMFARFWIPITPVCLLLLENGMRIISRQTLVRAVLAAVILASILFRWNQFVPETAVIHGISYERAAYPAERMLEAKKDGARLKKYLHGLDVRAAFYGMKAMLVYYSELPYVLEGAAGLTDEYIAHLPVGKRGRPGHEKRAPLSYLVKQRVNFVLGGTFRDSPDPDQLQVISFDGTICHIVVYENRVMEALKTHPEVRFIDFPAYLDRYIEQIESVPRDRRRQDLENFRQYYFNHNRDLERYAALVKRLDG